MQYEQTIVLYQPLLHSIAYNLVRCKEDAEDIVQETFLKWLSKGPEQVENLKAYLIKAVTNNCLTHLNTLKRKKEELLSNLPSPDLKGLFKEMNLAHIDLDINLNAALKVVFHKLEPLERVVYLLKEVFDEDYETVQTILNKKKDHCRQLFFRAKTKLKNETSKIHFDLPDSTRFLEIFKNACHFGNTEELIQELKKDIQD